VISPRGKLYAAYAAVYLIWGSTYLAIRIGVETLPPFSFAATRYLLAGLPLLAWLRSRGHGGMSVRLWAHSALLGGLMLAGGNGLVTFAETTVPSSIAALLITTVPLWMVLLDALVWRRSRLGVASVAGLACGFLGVVLLVGPAGDAVGRLDWVGVGALLTASLSWAIGSLLSRSLAQPKNPIVAVAAQMTAGGSILLIVAGLRGEWSQIDLAEVSRGSVIAILYLAVFGSVVALNAYAYLLRNQPASSVSTYAFVNPVVAVTLGVVFAGEMLVQRQWLAGILIIGAVILMHRARLQRARRPDHEMDGKPERRTQAAADAVRTSLTSPNSSATRNTP
jgi:drug/metabolite transporter (DMT)-like permease